MFWGKKKILLGVASEETLRKQVEEAHRQYESLKHDHKLEIAEIESDHKLALKDKEFELKHFKDEEIQKLNKILEQAQKDNAVLKKENEMLVKITDLNADVIDVKGLVKDLIKKLPEVNINSLTVLPTEKK